ncbi:diguanylate cyclase [Desulforegula conservatrix]|uniref:diguanylate cyclase n=1 Tax=Desulforegula conservatrix TaxID=153026 RepID=UPI0003F54D85|nr:diguanylate cyclase [Desulforegula conservatrix]
MIADQLLDIVDNGVVIIDEDYSVIKWNPWMEKFSGIKASEISNKPLFDFYPHLKESPGFIRNTKSVFKFKNVVFMSQKLHKFLFPMTPRHIKTGFEFMQQRCTMGPLHDAEGRYRYLYIIVYDVTELAASELENRKLSVTDALTGSYNRRFFENRLKEEFDRHARYHRPLSIIVFDIDFFKQVNDTYGHLGGDFILKNFAEKIRNRIRSVDLFARYGGEEFCCLLPETCNNEAVKLGESIRLLIEDSYFNYNDTSIRITVSQGVAELLPDKDTPDSFFKRADKALYVSKETGRNKVTSGNSLPELIENNEQDSITHDQGCPKCGSPLHFKDNPVSTKCDICKKARVAVVQCGNGHSVCDSCQNKRIATLIQNICLTTEEKDMIVLLETIIGQAAIAVCSPAYHLLVPAVILTTYRNLGGNISETQIKTGLERGKSIPYGSCGFSGICAASAGVGIALSIILEASPDKMKERNLLIKLTGQINQSLSQSYSHTSCFNNVVKALSELAEVSDQILPFRLLASEPHRKD